MRTQELPAGDLRSNLTAVIEAHICLSVRRSCTPINESDVAHEIQRIVFDHVFEPGQHLGYVNEKVMVSVKCHEIRRRGLISSTLIATYYSVVVVWPSKEEGLFNQLKLFIDSPDPN